MSTNRPRRERVLAGKASRAHEVTETTLGAASSIAGRLRSGTLRRESGAQRLERTADSTGSGARQERISKGREREDSAETKAEGPGRRSRVAARATARAIAVSRMRAGHRGRGSDGERRRNADRQRKERVAPRHDEAETLVDEAEDAGAPEEHARASAQAAALEAGNAAKDAARAAGKTAGAAGSRLATAAKGGLAKRMAEAGRNDVSSRNERIRRREASTTRALGASTAVAVDEGRAELVPEPLTHLARRAAARAATRLGAAAIRAIAAVGAAIAAALPALVPLAMLVAVLMVVASVLGSVAANQAVIELNGGQQIAAVAEAEYASGVANGDYHMGGGKYRSWFGIDADWCAIFVSWCADQCGFIDQGIMPKLPGCNFDDYFGEGAEYGGAVFLGPNAWVPAQGDIFVYGQGVGGRDHVGLVTEVLPDGSFYTVEGNTSMPGGGYSGWQSAAVNKKLHTKTADGWSNTYGGKFTVSRPNYPTIGGSTIEIPEPYGWGGYTVTEYDLWFEDWAGGTNQRRVADEWASKGSRWLNDIACIDGRYLVACTTTYGDVGDRLTFYLSDGTAIPCIMADAKSMSDPGCNEWGHSDGQNILEFEVKSSRFRSSGNPGSSEWMPEWAGKRVARCVNESRQVGNSGVVSTAQAQLGKPYVWAAEGPDCFDCSGLVTYCYRQCGREIPHWSVSQYELVSSLGNLTTDVGSLKPGDLVFFDYTGTVGHVGIYVGGGRYIHAPAPGYSVAYGDLSSAGGSFVGGGTPY